MDFPFIGAEPIRSATQRALFSEWDRAAKGQPFPPFEKFKPTEDLHGPKQLVIWQVEATGLRDRKFTALYQGQHIASAFGTAWVGRTLEEVSPPFARDIALASALECALYGCAVYTILSTADAAGHRIDCDRLLLPLGRHGKVEQIVSSLQLVSARGSDVRDAALEQFEASTKVSFSGKIRSSRQ